MDRKKQLKATEENSFSFTIDSPHLWNAEEPFTYELTLTKDSKTLELHTKKFGFAEYHPAFYEIATELGIYFMDEADIEIHGAYVCSDMGYFSKLPEWYPALLDRVTRTQKINRKFLRLIFY